MADYPISTTYYVVSGAGSSEFNGNYFYDSGGTINGQPYYTKQGASDYHIYWAIGDDWAAWVIDIGIAADWSGVGPYAAGYTTYPGSAIDGAWDYGSAAAPNPPTVTQSSVITTLHLNGVRGKWLNDGEGVEDYISGVNIPSVYNISSTEATVNVCAALYKDDGAGHVDFVTESAEVGIVYSESGGLYALQDIDIYFPTVINPDYNTYYFAYVWAETNDLRVYLDVSETPSADYGHYIDDSTGYNEWPVTEVNQTGGSKLIFAFITTNSLMSNASYSADSNLQNYYDLDKPDVVWGANIDAVYEKLIYNGNSTLDNTKIIYDYDATYGDVILDDGSTPVVPETLFTLSKSFSFSSTYEPNIATMVDPENPYAQGLVGLWLFNEGTGNIIHDVTGSGYNGVMYPTMDPATDWVLGNNGWSVDLDANYDYITFGKNELWNPRYGDLSVCIRFYDRSYGTVATNYRHVVKQDASSSPYPGWAIQANGTSDTDLQFQIRDTTSHVVSSVFPRVHSVWTTIVATLKRDGNATVYRDGAIVGTPVSAAVLEDVVCPQNLVVGCYDAGTSGFFNGFWAYLSVYNRALGEDEAIALSRDCMLPVWQPKRMFVLG